MCYYIGLLDAPAEVSDHDEDLMVSQELSRDIVLLVYYIPMLLTFVQITQVSSGREPAGAVQQDSQVVKKGEKEKVLVRYLQHLVHPEVETSTSASSYLAARQPWLQLTGCRLVRGEADITRSWDQGQSQCV